VEKLREVQVTVRLIDPDGKFLGYFVPTHEDRGRPLAEILAALERKHGRTPNE
jgi:hypothetical protein